ncbi:MAG: Ig-like domain-containing protein, partial [Methanobrevibacter sp.]|nr:Ig-like domain-containing protein [Methanobrevibacter sp.]
INGSESGIIVLDDEYANASVSISDLGVGTHTIGVKYNGNDEFIASDVAYTTINVAPKSGSNVVIVPVSTITYGDNVTIQYTVLNATTIKINVGNGGLQPVYNDTIVANVSEYSGSFVLSNLAAGDYLVVVYNEGNDNYTFSVDTVEFTVNKAEPTMQTEITPDIKVGDVDVVIKVVLPEDATGNVMLVIDEQPVTQMGYNLINGTVNITVPADILTAGKHSYYVNYGGDNNYTSVYDLHSFEVSKLDPMVVITVIPDADTKEPAAVSIFVGNITGGLTVARATGQILIKGYGLGDLQNLVDGIYTLNLIDIVPGDYEINVTYFGDGKFNNASNSTKFTVPKRAATVEITDVTENIIYGQNATFTVNMNPDSANGNVTIYINGTESGIIVLDDEYANITVLISDLGVGTHTIGVKYNGNDHYNASDVVNTIVTVAKAGSKVTIKPIGEVTYGNDVTIQYTVLNATNIKINVGYGGLQPVYNDTFDANVSEYTGSFVLSNLTAGEY